MPLINGKLILLLSSGKDGCPTNWSSKSLTIGSSNTCDGFIHSDQVDELHCVLQLREDGHACICNVARPEFSTFIDNVRVAESADLNHKSVLTVGNISFRFEYPAYSKWFVADVDTMNKKATPRKSNKEITPKSNTYTVLSHNTDSPTVTPIKTCTMKIKTVTPKGRLNIRPFITPVPKRLTGKSIRKSTAANNLIMSERTNRSKQVSFGPYLSPEQFDQEMPPMVPLKKGATPLFSDRKVRKSNRISEIPKEIKSKGRKFSIVSDDSFVTERDNRLSSKKKSSRLLKDQDISILSMGSSVNTSQSSVSSSIVGLKKIRKSLENKDSPVFYGNRRLSERSSNIYDYSEDNELSFIEDISEKETVQGMDSLMERGRKSSSMTNASLFSEVGSINSSKRTPISKRRKTSTSDDASYLMRSSDDLSLISDIEDENISLKRGGRKSSSLVHTRNSAVSKKGRGSMLMKSRRDSSAEFDDSSLSGLKELVKTPQAKSMRVSSGQDLMKSTEDLSHISNEKETNQSFKRSSRKSSAFLDNSNLSGVKQLLKTPKTQKSMRLSGVQDLMRSLEDLPLISSQEETHTPMKKKGRKSSRSVNSSSLSKQENEINLRGSNVRTSSIPMDSTKTADKSTKLNKTDNTIKIDKTKFIGNPRSFSTPKPAQRRTDMDADESSELSQISTSKDGRDSSFRVNLSSIVDNVPEKELKEETSETGDHPINISIVSEKETLNKSRRSKSVTNKSVEQKHSVVFGSDREEVNKSQSILRGENRQLNATNGSEPLELSKKVEIDDAKKNIERKSMSSSNERNLLKRNSLVLNGNRKSNSSKRNEQASSSNLDEMISLSSTRKSGRPSSHSRMSENVTKSPSAKEVEKIPLVNVGEKVDLPLDAKLTRNKRQIVSDIQVNPRVKRTKKETQEIEEPLNTNLRSRGKNATLTVENKDNAQIRKRKVNELVQIAEITADEVSAQKRKGKLMKDETIEEDKVIAKKGLTKGRRGNNLKEKTKIEDATEAESIKEVRVRNKRGHNIEEETTENQIIVPEVVKRQTSRGRNGKNVENETTPVGITETPITTKKGLRGKKATAVIEETVVNSIKKVETRVRKKHVQIMESEPEEVVMLEFAKKIVNRGRRNNNKAEETIHENIEVAENVKNAKDEIIIEGTKKVGTRGRKRKNDEGGIIQEKIAKVVVATAKRGKKTQASASMEDNLVIEPTKRVGTRSKKVLNEISEDPQSDKLVVGTSKVTKRKLKQAVVDNDVVEQSDEEICVPRPRRKKAADTETEIMRPLNTRSTRNRK